MITVLEPANELLRRYVDSIYVFKRGEEKLEFTAYPSTNTPVGLFRNAAIEVADDRVDVTASDTACHFAMVCDQYPGSIQLHYAQMVDEIAINFKPLGYRSFTGASHMGGGIYRMQQWDDMLPALFAEVFAAEDSTAQLRCIETFLLGQYRPLAHEAVLRTALQMLGDIDAEHRVQDIAAIACVHEKQLYRLFADNVGCSPAYYRKLLRFRTSVVSKLQQGSAARLVDICYDNAYTDQAYFIRQFKALSGQPPARFFKEVSSFGNEKVIFKIDGQNV